MKGSAGTTTLLASVLLAAALTLAAAGESATGRSSAVCRPQGKYLVGDPQNCRSYYYCFEGQSFPGVCAAGHRFDEKRQSCLQSSVAECFHCPPLGVSNQPNATKCDRYVLCFLGVAHERLCPPGTLFNRLVGQCDLSQKVVCPARN